jgi:hypothetical protein
MLTSPRRNLSGCLPVLYRTFRDRAQGGSFIPARAAALTTAAGVPSAVCKGVMGRGCVFISDSLRTTPLALSKCQTEAKAFN